MSDRTKRRREKAVRDQIQPILESAKELGVNAPLHFDSTDEEEPTIDEDCATIRRLAKKRDEERRYRLRC